MCVSKDTDSVGVAGDVSHLSRAYIALVKPWVQALAQPKPGGFGGSCLSSRQEGGGRKIF